MKTFEILAQDIESDGEPKIRVVLKRDGEEVLRREARVFSEDDMIQASNAIVGVGTMSQTDVDQTLASLIEPIRIKWLRSQDQRENGGPEQPTPDKLPRYVAVTPRDGQDQEVGIRDLSNDRVLSNFALVLDEDIEVQDDIESWREFAGRLITGAGTSPFRITAKDFADNAKLKAALFAAGGCELVIHCSMDELRRAFSTLSKAAGQVRRRKLTTNFGWTPDGKTYLTPSVEISTAGIGRSGTDAGIQVDLAAETPARHLDLKLIRGDDLLRVKRHIVADLLPLNDRSVTHTLLGATAAAVLYPFAAGAGRFALWLVGRTGAGKSFVAKLFSNFFGNFPVSSAQFTTWSATPNYVQRQGYFFKDALYLVDDYKPEVVQAYQVVRVLQTYADGSARGRLKSDATANVLRPIRGLLVCTGEDVPEHNASAVARSVIIKVPQQAKNVAAGTRCLNECQNYAAVMADFIGWLITGNRMAAFAARFVELQQRYYSDVAGQQNDIRIATNLAQLGAAFELFAEYLADAWDGWQEAGRQFVEEDLITVRDNMLGEAKEQQGSEVFLRTLAELIRFNHVRVEGLTVQRDAEHKPLIGRVPGARPGVVLAGPDLDRLEICTSLALAQVNACLRQQGRPDLKITESALLQQLREDGRLLDQKGEPLPAGAELTRRVRLDNKRQMRAFVINRRELLGD
ncbi:MAG: hypothetical protein FJ271_28290 [Planctomycetes bacterium]|nr:hypothetical protein [Planctomycetota bacterium]